MQHNNNLIPSLRFPEFEGEWDVKKLGEITKINQGLQISISKRYTEKVKGSYFYITNEFLKSNSNKKYFIQNPSASVLCVEEDILMTRTGNTGQVVTGVKGAFHNNFFKINFDKKSCYKWYLYYFLTSYKTQGNILKLAGSSTIPDLNHGDFYNIKIPLPSLPEQQKIANFLALIDKKISLLKEKTSLLQQFKKGMMQQLFSQKIRFLEENGEAFPDWEETTLGAYLKESRIKGDTGDKAKKLTVKLWGKGVYKKEEATQGSINTKYYIRKSGQIIYSKLDFLNCAFAVIPEELNNFQSTLDLPSFDVSDNGNVDFIINRIKEKSFYKKYGDMANGSRKAKRIHPRDFLTFPLSLPSLPEQEKIANCLNTIDQQIENSQKQEEETQNYKKGLLQQLLV